MDVVQIIGGMFIVLYLFWVFFAKPQIDEINDDVRDIKKTLEREFPKHRHSNEYVD